MEEFNSALIAKRDGGAKNIYETFIPAAAEYGYELTAEEPDEFIGSNSMEMTEQYCNRKKNSII